MKVKATQCGTLQQIIREDLCWFGIQARILLPASHDHDEGFPNSMDLSTDALTPLSTTSLKPRASNVTNAACVVPLGLVTFFRSCAGLSADSTSILPAP